MLNAFANAALAFEKTLAIVFCGTVLRVMPARPAAHGVARRRSSASPYGLEVLAAQETLSFAFYIAVFDLLALLVGFFAPSQPKADFNPMATSI